MHAPLRIAISLICLCSASLVAQEAAKTVAPKATAVPVAATQAQAISLQNYWTPERLASARPMPLPKVDPSTVLPALAPAVPEPIRFVPGGRPSIHLEPALEPAPEMQLERFPLNTGETEETEATPLPEGFTYPAMPFNNFRTGINNSFPYSAIGKLFFVIPAGASEAAGNYVCSAAVAIDNHTIVTARHCTFDIGKKVWYKNWVFYPGWNNGSNSALHGAWYPNTVITWTSGTNVLSLTTGYDIAMMTMHDSTNTGCGGDKGNTIGQYTGWLGSTYNGDYSARQWNNFGYPQAAPFEGNYLYQNNGATGAVNPLGSTNVVEVGDPQTGGTSGGPWIIGFDPGNNTVPNPNNNTANGFNYANGVNSFVWTSPNQPNAMNGTVFVTGNFWNLYTALKAKTCS